MNLRSYISDYKQIVRLGAPIIVGQAGMIAVGFADNIMVGNYSTDALSAASFVNNTFNMAALACLGFTYGITPLVGALFARGKKSETGSLLRNALALNVLYTLLITLAMGAIYLNVERLGQPSDLIPLIKPYFLLYLAGLLPIAIYNVLAQCSYGMRDTAMPMWVVLAANLLNVLGNYALIYGNWSAPELGLLGAGIATLLSRLFSAGCIALIFMRARRFAELRQGFVAARISLPEIKKVWRTSLPVSGQLFFETAAFSGTAFFVGWLGKIELAAFQIMLIIGTLGFCFYYSLGSATSVLVANAAGRHDRRAMRRIGYAGYHLTLLLALCASCAFFFAGEHLIGAFTPDADVIAMALSLIPPLICYQLGDATQVNFANALRGTSRVTPMLWIAFVSYVIVGLPSSYLFGFTFGWGISGIFFSFSVSLFLAGALFLTFFLKYTRPSCE